MQVMSFYGLSLPAPYSGFQHASAGINKRITLQKIKPKDNGKTGRRFQNDYCPC